MAELGVVLTQMICLQLPFHLRHLPTKVHVLVSKWVSFLISMLWRQVGSFLLEKRKKSFGNLITMDRIGMMIGMCFANVFLLECTRLCLWTKRAMAFVAVMEKAHMCCHQRER